MIIICYVLFLIKMFQQQQQPLRVINTTPVNLFIPRLLPNVSKKYIIDYFKYKKIGIITDINAKYRVNENKNPYWFAFVSVQFFDTNYGKEMYNIIVEKEKTAYMTYNETEGKYWEISVRSQDRKDNISVKKPDNPIKPKPNDNMNMLKTKTKTKTNPLEDGEIDEENILDTNFTIYDHIEIHKDYMELEKEIYGNNAFSWESPTKTTFGKFIPLRI
jgi:hypothetical protein